MSVEESNISETMSLRAGSERHKKVKIRAAELGYQHVSDYLRDLIDDDLDDSEVVDA